MQQLTCFVAPRSIGNHGNGSVMILITRFIFTCNSIQMTLHPAKFKSCGGTMSQNQLGIALFPRWRIRWVRMSIFVSWLLHTVGPWTWVTGSLSATFTVGERMFQNSWPNWNTLSPFICWSAGRASYAARLCTSANNEYLTFLFFFFQWNRGILLSAWFGQTLTRSKIPREICCWFSTWKICAVSVSKKIRTQATDEPRRRNY